MTSPNTIIADLTAELSNIRNDYENACRLVARMHFAATGSIDGPKIGVVEDVEAIAAEVETLRKQRDELLGSAIGARNVIAAAILANWEGATDDDVSEHVTIKRLDSAIARAKCGS